MLVFECISKYNKSRIQVLKRRGNKDIVRISKEGRVKGRSRIRRLVEVDRESN